MEVKLAPKGTAMAEFQKERTDTLSEMFENKGRFGIYPTTELFLRLDMATIKFAQQKDGE